MYVYISAATGSEEDNIKHEELKYRLEHCGWETQDCQGSYTMADGEVSEEQSLKVKVRDLTDVEVLLIIAKHYQQESILVQYNGMNGVCELWFADGDREVIGRMFHVGNIKPSGDHSCIVDSIGQPNYYKVK